jgi:hypothetical protein
MPVMKRKLPDGSTEIISSPSVLKRNKETGKMEKVPTTRSVVSAEGEVIVPNTIISGAGKTVPKVVDPKAVDPRVQDTASILPIKADVEPVVRADMVMENIALLGMGLAKLVQFITRTGNVTNPVKIKINHRQEDEHQESLLPPELEKIVTAIPEELSKMAGVNEQKEILTKASKEEKNKANKATGRNKKQKGAVR